MRAGLVGCDDETLWSLAGQLRRYGRDASTGVRVDSFEDAASLCAACSDEKYRYDLVVLDCDADFAGGGIAEARRLRAGGALCPLVLVASDERCAVDGYGVGAVGYLLKPVGCGELAEVLARIASLPAAGRAVALLTVGSRKMSIDVSQLMCCHSSGHYVILHRCAQPPMRVRVNFCDVERSLEPFPQICRSTRGCLVNLDYVVAVEGFDFVLTDGSRAPIGRRNASRVKAAYRDYIGARCA